MERLLKSKNLGKHHNIKNQFVKKAKIEKVIANFAAWK